MHRRIYQKNILKILLILIIFSFTSCKEREIKTDTNYSLDVAKVVSHVTSGIIPLTSQITVRFVAPVVDKKETGKNIDIYPFSFTPSISGNTQWKDERTLVFIPEKELPLNTTFSGSIDLTKVLNPDANPDLKNMDFSFKTINREIGMIKSDFVLQQENNPENVYYQGEVAFNAATALNDIKEAIKLTETDKDIPLEWTEGKNNNFSFKSALLKRDKEQKRFTLKLDKTKLALKDDYKKSFNLESVDTMKITEINNLEQDKQLGFEILFTDKLDPNQDNTGFISIEPKVEFKVKADEKKLRVTGDFKHGKNYSLKVNHGLKSVWGTVSQEDFKKEISFDDIKPQVNFSSDGVFLPSDNQQKIYFKTMNLSGVRLTVKKVFESNLGQFLQTEKLASVKNRTESFDSYSVERIGVNVAEQDLEIGEKKNVWLQHELDLKKLIKPGEKGLFLVIVSFEKKDMLYQFTEDKEAVYDGEDYYNNPNSDGYVNSFGSVYKALIMSDIGLTYKKGFNQNLIYATNIISARPENNVVITLRNYQNQVLATKITDGDGKALFTDIKEEVFYIEGEKESQRSVIQPNEMAWNLSTFDTGGEDVQDDGTRAYIYTERGVYRPGDTVNLSVIARNDDNKFPDNHPMTIKIYNPLDQLIYEQTKKDGKDGFYSFEFNTNENDMTGNWGVDIIAGTKTFHHLLKIETVIPNRLKVKFENTKPELNPQDKTLKFNLISNYLFGNPASNLDANVSVTLKNNPKQFKDYPNYTFNNESIDYKDFKADIFKSKLDKDGKAVISWDLPALTKVPSGINADISAKVLEKGGRDTENNFIIPINPYDFYVGLQKPDNDYGYSKVGDTINLKAVIVNTNGKAIPSKKLKYTIYKNNRHWWWEFDNQNQYRLHYKNDTETEVIKEGNIVSQNEPVAISFNPEDSGEYFVEVKDASANNGHSAGYFFSASYWGESTSSGKDEGILTLKSDKKVYNPGETATISFPIPEKGQYLVSIEKGNKILKSYWYTPSGNNKEAKVEVPVTPEMMPTSYFSVSVIQPHEQTINDRPIRMYGVIPINIEDKTTRQGIEIKMANELQAKKPFDVEIQTQDNKQTQFTVAVVDEGLLDLTNFKTPDPWSAFYKKLRLGVTTHDLFSFVIGANKGDIFKTFSIGGDLDYRINQQEMKKAKRFKLVSMFKGPMMTDENGHAKVSFVMPEYLGSVRVMVMAASGNRYASAEKAVPVKSDLMILPTLPRVLSPQDSIIVPVTVFATKDSIKNVSVSIKTEGPISIDGGNVKNITFDKIGDKDVYFKLNVLAQTGNAKIVITGNSGNFTESNTTDINIRPASPRVFASENKKAQLGSLVSFDIPNRGIAGSNHSMITVSRRNKLNVNNRMEYLINYPYGCIEQTVSAVFPQLFLREFIKTTDRGDKKIDSNINLAINTLRKFQLNNGAFSYWQGQTDNSIWGTNYAGHFMLEAEKLGYHVSDEILDNWLKFQKSQSLNTQGKILERVYRVYLLSLAGQPEFGAMNLLKENELKKMSNTEKWLLAGAYKLAGVEQTARQITSEAGLDVKDYSELDGTYGSGLRDKAIILEMLTLFKLNDKADKVYNEIVEALSTDTWYSTQTLGYSLMALGKYMQANDADFNKNPNMSGYVLMPDGKKVGFNTTKASFSQNIPDGFEGKKAQVYLDKSTNLKNIFLTLQWNGIPVNDSLKDENNNLKLTVNWVDENGKNIDINKLKQGTSFYGHFRVENISGIELSELALVQVMPSGWEIENTRIVNEDIPEWAAKFKLNMEKYSDIRDDRVMWFFDLNGGRKYLDFVVKLNSVTQGKFDLPSTIAETMYSRNYRSVKAGKNVEVN